ncbi:uncharacterized protein M6B38_196380 [Iris pallida]|uniref:Remorin C-terminal domain-containing protein n=1 Tax=Iris pallida TaxID=29817 RepID=A0AAX6ED10_IRIPA|nr:uncharacterized protein M6B38_196380 [Iris pallida]
MGSCVDEKKCYSSPSPNTCYNKKPSSGRRPLGSRRKPTPSKWDDAQKWLVGLSIGGGGGGGGHCNDAKPRDSNADDRSLLAGGHAPHGGRDSCSSIINEHLAGGLAISPFSADDEGETKKIDRGGGGGGGDKPMWRTGKPAEEPPMAARSVCLRDMGTEMTPTASKEPSRSGTPLRARSPAVRSPVGSRSTSPAERKGRRAEAESEERSTTVETSGAHGRRSSSLLETRASAWDEAERTKYMARYKRKEVKIQAWENHERMKAEMAMKKMEVKAERLKNRATEKLASKMASTRRVAEEKRSSAEVKLNERGARTSERADYIRRTGRLPSSFFSFKLPSMCN